MPCVGPCCRRCFWPSSAVVCHGGWPVSGRPVTGLPPWCIRRWFPPDVKSPLAGVPKETSCLGLPSRRFLPCSPAWCDSVAAGSWEVVPLSVLCVCVANRPLNSCCVAGTMNKPACPARPTTWSTSGFLLVAVSVPHHANCPCTTSSKQAQGLSQPRMGLQQVLLIGFRLVAASRRTKGALRKGRTTTTTPTFVGQPLPLNADCDTSMISQTSR